MSAFRAASDRALTAPRAGLWPGAGLWRARLTGAGASLAAHGALLALLLLDRWQHDIPLTQPTPPFEVHSIALHQAVPARKAAVPALHPARLAHGRPAGVARPRPVAAAQPAAMAPMAADAAAPPAVVPAANAAAATRPAPAADPEPPIAARHDDGAVPAAYAHQVWLRIMACRPRGIVLAGTVGLHFRIARDGRLAEAAIARSSGMALLDHAAMQALRRAAPFPLPPGDSPATALQFDVAVHFGATP